MVADVELRSARFRREREQSWRNLERIVDKADRRRRLDTQDLRALPELYRATLSSLSVARAIALDRSLIAYLETLAARAYLVLYAPRMSFTGAMGQFFARDWPQSVRDLGSLVWLAGAALVAGVVLGWHLVAVEPGYYLSIVPQSLQQGRSPVTPPEVLRESIYPQDVDFGSSLSALAAFLFRNNASVALLAFGLGIALGIPTLLLLFYNGTILGAFLALFQRADLLFDLTAWLSVHGTTELFAIVLSGAAGLALAHGLLYPHDNETRYQSVSRQGRKAAVVAVGAIVMLFVAAFLEGFIRQLVQNPYPRLAIGMFFLALWSAYFAFAGRDSADGR